MTGAYCNKAQFICFNTITSSKLQNKTIDTQKASERISQSCKTLCGNAKSLVDLNPFNVEYSVCVCVLSENDNKLGHSITQTQTDKWTKTQLCKLYANHIRE